MCKKSFGFIVLTGSPGSGKTTLVKKVCNSLKKKGFSAEGFFTEEIRPGRERIGFDVVLLNGERAPLARLNRDDRKKQPLVGKYAVDVESFESRVVPILKRRDKNSILVLDEIGKMELLSPLFNDAVRSCIDSNESVILATIPLKSAFKTIEIVERIRCHPRTILFNVTKENRNRLEGDILNHIEEIIR